MEAPHPLHQAPHTAVRSGCHLGTPRRGGSSCVGDHLWTVDERRDRVEWDVGEQIEIVRGERLDHDRHRGRGVLLFVVVPLML